MLLFIPPIMLSKSIRPVFQYISCYCLSMSLSFVTLDFANFNTSHVAVYPYTYRNHIVYNTISIHLMLLFIPVMIMWYNRMFFISIHLMLLFILSACNATYKCFFISIHLMLLFIVPSPNFPSPSPKFQYISCYCLSQHCSQFPVNSPNFNTSHVTVYRIGTHPKAKGCKFQYISCYCLSRGDDNKNTIREIFQYISCYCLSDS